MSAGSPITPYVPWEEFRAVYDLYGGPALYARIPDPPRWLRGTVAARWTAEQFRQLTDDVLPDRPRLVADALDELAARHEARPVSGDDIIDVREEDREVFLRWADCCRERSEMLDPIRLPLDWLGNRDPRVEGARIVLGYLADADLLLPGIDAELRPVLARYAGLDGAR